MRPAPLTTIKSGINRLRLKGGARADGLYDLLNGYATEQDTCVNRPGTERVATLSSSTRGLVAFGETLHTFSHENVEVPEGYTLNVLVHPDSTEDDAIALEKIHFAEPFMGALYVVAEFDGGDIYHYWLETPQAWEPEHVYKFGDIIEPSEPTGLVYRATRNGAANPSWAPNVLRYDGTGYEAQSVVEPTVYNDFYYVCILTVGGNPRSGETEPTWPTEEGATVTEETSGGITSNPVVTPDPSAAPSSVTTGRYGQYIPSGRSGLVIR